MAARARRIRMGGLLALLGGRWGLLLSPLATAAYFAHDWSRAAAPPWVQLVQRWLHPLLSFGRPEAVYQTYGRAFLLVLLAFLGGLVALHSSTHAHSGRLGRLGFQLAFGGLGLNLLGNLGDYWLGAPVVGDILAGFLFMLGTGVGMLLYTGGAILIGRDLLQRQRVPPWGAWLLILAPVCGIAFTIWPIQHIPSGYILPLSLTWVLLGRMLMTRGTRATRVAQRE